MVDRAPSREDLQHGEVRQYSRSLRSSLCGRQPLSRWAFSRG